MPRRVEPQPGPLAARARPPSSLWHLLPLPPAAPTRDRARPARKRQRAARAAAIGARFPAIFARGARAGRALTRPSARGRNAGRGAQHPRGRSRRGSPFYFGIFSSFLGSKRKEKKNIGPLLQLARLLLILYSSQSSHEETTGGLRGEGGALTSRRACCTVQCEDGPLSMRLGNRDAPWCSHHGWGALGRRAWVTCAAANADRHHLKTACWPYRVHLPLAHRTPPFCLARRRCGT